MGSRNPPTVTFALKVLKELMKSRRVDPGSVVDRLGPALHARTKGTVKQALSLLEMAVRQSEDSDLSRRSVAVAAEGLVHESADVQEDILAFLDRYGDPLDRSLRELLMVRRDGVAVSLKGRLEVWLGLQEGKKNEPAEDGLGDLEHRAAALEPRLAVLAGVPEASLPFAVSDRTFLR